MQVVKVGAPGGKKVTRSLLRKAKQFAYHLFGLRMGRYNVISQGVKEGLFFILAVLNMFCASAMGEHAKGGKFHLCPGC